MKFGLDKEYLGSLTLLLAYFMIISGCVFLAVYSVGGVLSLVVVGVYGSWVLLGLALRAWGSRLRKGLRTGGRDYMLLGLSSVVNLLMWFTFPFGLCISVLAVAGLITSYVAQERRLKCISDNR